MSLINQMLQDLEQRSVAGASTSVPSGIHGQVRAVPDRRRIHPAWWLVLLLTLFLIAAVVWYLTRPAPPAQQPRNLTLKIAPQLGSLPSPAAQEPLPPDSDASPVIQPKPVPVPVPAQAAQAEMPKPSKPPIEPMQAPEKPAAVKLAEAPSVIPQTRPEEAKPANLTKQISELTPQQHAENEYREAGLMIQAGRQVEAIAMLQQAVKLDARHVGARQTLIGLLLQQKRTDDAVKAAQDGLALDPAQSGLSMILARVQLEQGDQHAALATMEHGLQYAGANADYHAFTAALMIREKRNRDAIDQYTLALTAQPQNGVWWMGLGMALQSENHLPEAHEAFLRAKRSNTLTPELQAFVEQKLAQLPKP